LGQKGWEGGELKVKKSLIGALVGVLILTGIAGASTLSGGVGWTTATVHHAGESSLEERAWVFDGGIDLGLFRLGGSYLMLMDEKEDAQADYTLYNGVFEFRLPLGPLPLAAYVGGGYTGDSLSLESTKIEGEGLFAGARALADLDGVVLEGYYQHSPRFSLAETTDGGELEYDAALTRYGASLRYLVVWPLEIVIGYKGSLLEPGDDYQGELKKVQTNILTAGGAVSF
jgi:hypothetical protein